MKQPCILLTKPLSRLFGLSRGNSGTTGKRAVLSSGSPIPRFLSLFSGAVGAEVWSLNAADLYKEWTKAVNIARSLGYRSAAGYLRNRNYSLNEALYMLIYYRGNYAPHLR